MEVCMSRSSGFFATFAAMAAIAAAAVTFLVVCVPMSTLWFAAVPAGA
jgi:hypothetical protein